MYLKTSLFLIALLGALPGFALATTQTAPSREQLREYYQTGKYHNDVENKIAAAKQYLDAQLEHPRPNKLAIVLDIDETALSNYRDLERLAFTRNTQAMTGAYMMGTAEPMLSTLHLYQYAIERGVAVFFISERPNTTELMTITARNLKAAGFEQWQELILKPLDNEKLSTQEFKTKARHHISLQGYDIILNVGDQESDLKGGYAEVKVKLPNPFYEHVS